MKLKFDSGSVSRLVFAIFLSVAAVVPVATTALEVVTTTTDMAALAREVGGNLVNVSSIAKGTQDPHKIAAKPSFMVRLRNVDLVVAQGLDLETAWIEPLIRGARNPKIVVGSRGYIELGDKLEPIEIPPANVSRSEGDVHAGGNPHFQLDPIRMGKAAVLLAERMGELDPANITTYKSNAEKLQKRLQEKDKEWKMRLQKSAIKEVVTFHKGLSYFLQRYGIAHTLQLEPRPGVPPSASHLLNVLAAMKERNVRIILTEVYNDPKAGEKIAAQLPGAKALVLPTSVESLPDIKTNEELIERVVKTLEDSSK